MKIKKQPSEQNRTLPTAVDIKRIKYLNCVNRWFKYDRVNAKCQVYDRNLLGTFYGICRLRPIKKNVHDGWLHSSKCTKKAEKSKKMWLFGSICTKLKTFNQNSSKWIKPNN